MSAGTLRVGYVAGWSPTRAPGLARYATELFAALRRVAPQDELVELGSPQEGARRLAWTLGWLPWGLRHAGVDVVHLTSHPAPFLGRRPMVLTLHDLSLLREPGTHPRRRVLVMAPMLRSAVRRAAQVIVPSQATADDATNLLGLDPVRLHVIHEAAAASFHRVVDPAVLAATAQRHDLRPGYLLALGTLEPRKNLVTLVEAWLRLRADGWDGQLVLAGGAGWRTDVLDARLTEPEVAPHVRRLGHVPEPELPAVLSLAGAFAYPSLLEGFGLPVVEALACGVPTVTSDLGATAEVAGDAALLVDPRDPVALATAIGRALAPGPERERLIAAGPVRAAAFDWDTAARATARVYHLAAPWRS